MEYPLIANSGIQFFVCDLTIDLNSKSKQLFHEWFDEEEVQTNLELAYMLRESQKVVRLADMEECRFVNEDGSLNVKEEEVLANPNIEIIHEGDIEDSEEFFSLRLSDEKRSKLNNLLDQWLPLPYFEFDTLGNCKGGPYNWVRCKLIPQGEGSTPNELPLKVLIAFDTRALYEEPDEYVECPTFTSDSEKEKSYRLSCNASQLIDFCSGRNSWIRSYLMNIVHGVTEVEDIHEEKGQDSKYSFLASYMLLMDTICDANILPNVRLIRDRGVKSIGVEMIVDIGNSRTAAIMFENGDFTRVQPLKLQNFTFPIKNGKLNRTEESFDMRLAFQKVSFGEGTLIGSHQFIWPSLVRLGTEAEHLTHETTNLAEGDEILSTYSSPKRYLWDTKARREEWRQVRLNANGEYELPIIDEINRYLNDDGSFNPDGNGFGLHYSRKSLMTLAFLEILSQARVQVNSYEYREFNGRLSTPRRIEKVILTCPTAMSKDEQRSLHNSLQDALSILDKFNGDADSTSMPMHVQIVPDLEHQDPDNPKWIFDEATCSQFVYLYGQMTSRYLNCSKQFFDLYGKERQDENGVTNSSIVVGSLDIGAGTSDIMICRYDYNENNDSRLKPIPIFWDSFDYAGDDMMRTLISNILLQGERGQIEKELAVRGVPENEIRRMIYGFFGDDNASLSFKDRIMRRDFNLQVLVPIMSYFLGLLSNDEVYREVSYDEVFAECKPSAGVTAKFKEHFGFPLEEIRWIYDNEQMTQNIERTMDSLLENIANVMYAYGCDIVLLSGRPTSLRPIREIFLKYFTVEPNRLIAINKYRIGNWYPFADAYGYLTNSKSVVPVGAMIGHLASSAGGFNDFSLDLSELGRKLKPTTNYFVVKDVRVQSNKSFITPEHSRGEIKVNSLPLYIGSRQFDFSLYPVRPFYVLDLNIDNIIATENRKAEKAGRRLNEGELQFVVNNHKDRIKSMYPLTVTIERDDFEENKELLTIESVVSADSDDDITASDLSLSVQSLNDPDCYWLDSGAFDINIKSNH